MRVDKITLSNFKCFEDRTIELAPRFTLIIGDNGKGKTSILDGLAVGLGSLFLGLPSPAKQRGIHKDEVRVRYFRQGQTSTKERQFPSSITANGEVFGQRGEWKRELTYDEGKTTRQDAGWITELAESANELIKHGVPNVLPVIAYYGTGRLWVMIRDRKVSTSGPQSRLLGYLDCLNPASDENRLITWFKTQEISAIQKAHVNQQLESCRQAIISCVPDATNVYFDVGEDQLMLQFNGDVIPFYYLSDGYRNTLAMVADIAVRSATLNPGLEADAIRQTPGVVLIDEIDLHLHPKWQRQVVQDLMAAFPLIQFVATTHSPFVIQSLPDSDEVNLLNLDNEEADRYANLSVEDITEEVQGIELPQRSQRFLEMMAAAEEYYALLRKANGTEGEELTRLKNRLDELSLPFSDDPAYQALLQSERIAANLDGEGGR